MTTKEKILEALVAAHPKGVHRTALTKRIKGVSQSGIDQAVQGLKRDRKLVPDPRARGHYILANGPQARQPAKPATIVPVAEATATAPAPAAAVGAEASVPKDVVVRVELSARLRAADSGLHVFFDGDDAPRTISWAHIVSLAAAKGE